MIRTRNRVFRRWACLVLPVSCLLLSPAAKASPDVVEDILTGLEALQFQFDGGYNPLSQGYNVSATRQFAGERLDFGASELLLNGPFQTSVEYGDRGWKTLDFSFSTLNSPLQYIFSSDTGGQTTVVSGDFNLDSNLSINQFGFYDLHMDFSSRQDISNDGRFADGTQAQDFDLGPVDISGNIFADLLAAVFDPLFEASNTTNIFSSFSGRQKLEDALARMNADAIGAADFEYVASMSTLLEKHGRIDGLELVDFVPVQSALTQGQNPIPEPTTLFLLAAGMGLLVRRSRQR